MKTANSFFNPLLLAIFLFWTNTSSAAEPLQVTIIEIGASEASGYEYIKISNNSNKPINLEGWKFVEGFSGSKPEGIKHGLNEFNAGFILNQNQEAIICQDPDKFLSLSAYNNLILDSSWSSLNESGERIQLLDENGSIIEDFTYPPSPDTPLKRINYILPDYSEKNWQVNSPENPSSSLLPKGGDNSSLQKERTSGSSEPATNNLKIIINEIFPNPEGVDNEKEYIELKNIGDTTINLKNWQIQDSSARIYTIEDSYYSSMFIRPNQFFVIYREKSKIALNNSGDTVKLYNIEGSLIDEVNYSESIEEKSYSRNDEGIWNWSETLTPGEKNIVPRLNEPPTIDISFLSSGNEVQFDASDSFDPDGDEMFFNWDFGDGGSSTLINPVHKFDEGEHKVKLLLFDGPGASGSKTIKINIGKMDSLPYDNGARESKSYARITLSEIFPNPAGRDDNEFVEIFNPTDQEINLKNWSIKDNSKTGEYKIEKEIIMGPEEYFAFYKKETGLNLNNNFEKIYLISPEGEIISETSYEQAGEEMSYNINSKGNWAWSYTLTPFEENETIDFEDVILPSPFYLENKIREISEDEIKNCEPGELIAVTGTVIAEPGLLGKQIFYINGAQVYMYSKDFPELHLGDKVTIIGEISTANNELRIKTKEKGDIIKLEQNEEPKITETYIENIDDNMRGNLIKISGEITEKTGNTLWLDDNTEEIKIYVNKYTGINLSDISLGQAAEITGILSSTESGLRILPRYLEDIKLGQVLGEKVYAAEDNIENDLIKKSPTKKYLLATLIAVFFIGAGIIWKNKKKEKNMR